jgi:uncharacterized protein YbjT (DUF2867 family)
MVSSIRSVMVVGATQGTGIHAVRRLVDKGCAVTVVARSAEKAQRVFQGVNVSSTFADVTRVDTLKPALFHGVDAVIWTVGVTQRPAPEALIRATEYDAVRSFLSAAAAAGFAGQFVYMTSIGVQRGSAAGALLNLIKRNTLRWRREAEAVIRASRLPYTIVRAGVLNDQPASARTIVFDQQPRGASFRYRISRADVAHVLVEALSQRQMINTSFNIYWGDAAPDKISSRALNALVPDERAMQAAPGAKGFAR